MAKYAARDGVRARVQLSQAIRIVAEAYVGICRVTVERGTAREVKILSSAAYGNGRH